MERVEEATKFPASCIFSPSASGPYVDTGRHLPRGERVYISEVYAKEIGEAVGLVEGEYRARAVELATELDEANRELEELRQELGALRASVRNTLLNGAVIPKEDKDKFKLRPVPGQKAVEV